MAKVLNLDAYVTPKRVLTWKGKSHRVREISVQEFIDSLAQAEEMEKSATAAGAAPDAAAEISKKPIDIKAWVEKSVGMVAEAIPTLPEAEIRTMEVEALMAVMAFIRGDLDPDAPRAAAPVSDVPDDAAAGGESTNQEGAAAKKT